MGIILELDFSIFQVLRSVGVWLAASIVGKTCANTNPVVRTGGFNPRPPLPSVKSHSQYLWISVRLQIGMEEMEGRNIVLCLVLL